jgi:hypothetical protein
MMLSKEELDKIECDWGLYTKVGTRLSLIAQARLALQREAELAALRAIVRDCEWSAYIDYGMSGCPECERSSSDGHRPGCAIAAALESAP